MFYIEDDFYKELLKSAEPVGTADPYGLQKRLEAYPVIRYWDSGEQIAPSSGEWEEQAKLIDLLGDQLYIEAQFVYHGERYGDKPPEFWRIPRLRYGGLEAEASA